ncbi:MAG: hypothetical protein IJR89_04505 [Clostridia bacterium]|nr:hypothetical protein [Clostridia bacterium]
MNGETVAYYEYDAWGKLLSVKDEYGVAITGATHIANINPIRYRGYYYDTESGFYYLRSRYYDPEICRFINPDAYVSTGQGVLGCNMFAYCGNDPVNKYDPFGLSARCYNTLDIGGGSLGMYCIVGLGVSFAFADGLSGFFESIATSLESLFNYRSFDKKTDGKEPSKQNPNPEPPNVDYLGNDPLKPPNGSEWRGPGTPGSKKGNYYNPNTRESLSPDLEHPDPIGPHWDYKGPTGKFRLFPDGTILPK